MENNHLYTNQVESNKKNIRVLINDDGPGFAEDVVKIIGEPYIRSKLSSRSSKAGLGLGTFLGKTLLERQHAKLNFSNKGHLNGALVSISWNIKDLTTNS